MQLRLWYDVPDLLEKIRKEKEAGMKTFYHFCGRPLPMKGKHGTGTHA